jgi:hypothetical protein
MQASIAGDYGCHHCRKEPPSWADLINLMIFHSIYPVSINTAINPTLLENEDLRSVQQGVHTGGEKEVFTWSASLETARGASYPRSAMHFLGE